MLEESLSTYNVISYVTSGGGTLKAPEQSLLNLYNPQLSVKSGYTLAEIVVVMLIIAVIVGVSIKITKSRLDNIISYTYYSTYTTLRTIASGMLADFNPEDELYQSKIIYFCFLVHMQETLLKNAGSRQELLGRLSVKPVKNGVLWIVNVQQFNLHYRKREKIL